MAEKKTNEILEAQRKARQAFLDLKKMQSGEMYAGPKPSETATVLKTPWEKFQNFWHYSKWYVIFTIGITILVAVMVAQCVSKPDYDLKVVYFTYSPVLDDQTSLIADYLDDYVEDVNGNGKVDIQVINCSVSNENSSVMTRNTMLQKLQSVIVAEESAMLFITDDKSDKYFDAMKSESGEFFHETSVKLGEDFYKATKHEVFGNLTENLTLKTRRVGGTVLESNKDCEKYFNAAKNAIINIQNSQKNK